ncbi:hypothetical protein K7I13_08880 [Brucepastera parasyntrophica]|uniref:hypothetical protein n=1 Tax=Brucepastera parasyntrophica TaxID=2880008 RepID=UPI0021089B68|nr:hypothetical protein [Brucepastera parasyntrophica]ULQ58671.1 hypothetical protein K7I13_08880 [Brucepastera parasyntrophica]
MALLVVIFFQIVLFSVVLLYGFILPQAKKNSFDILTGRVKNRSQHLENEMSDRWGNLEDGVILISRQVDAVLAEQDAVIPDMAVNDRLVDSIISRITPAVMYLLRKNDVTGAFCILNGKSPPEKESVTAFPGIYIRDFGSSDPVNAGAGWFPERGISGLLKEFNPYPALYRKTVFEFPAGGKTPDEFFYYKPLNAALLNQDSSLFRLGYWSPPFLISGDDTP